MSHVQNEMENLMHHGAKELLSVWKGARARREEVEYIRRHKMYTRVSGEVCLRETGSAPIKTGWAETDKGQPGQPNVRAR